MTGLSTRTRSSVRPWAWVIAGLTLWIVLLAIDRPVMDRLVYRVAGLDPGSRLGTGIHFFLTDTVKIMLLLVGVVFAAAVVRTFLTVERTRDLLGGRRMVAAYAIAALAGVATPFCSCSAVPVFIGFVAAGVPLGVTMTFLIASPLVNEVAVILVAGSFGWTTAVLYVATGLSIAIAAGVVIGHLGLERWIERFVTELEVGRTARGARPSWTSRFAAARSEVRSILAAIWPYLLIAIAVGAVIHGWVPDEFFVRVAGPGHPLAVPIAVVLGIPLYSNAAGTIPLIEALHAKGVAMGTSLAFMMSVVALSLPEMVLLRKVMRPQLLAVFVGVVACGILTVGFIFNAVL